MAGERLRRAVHDRVRAVVERALAERRRERVVDGEPAAGGVGGVRDRGDVAHVEPGIGGRLDPHQPRAVAGGDDRLGVGRHEPHLDAARDEPVGRDGAHAGIAVVHDHQHVARSEQPARAQRRAPPCRRRTARSRPPRARRARPLRPTRSGCRRACRCTAKPPGRRAGGTAPPARARAAAARPAPRAAGRRAPRGSRGHAALRVPLAYVAGSRAPGRRASRPRSNATGGGFAHAREASLADGAPSRRRHAALPGARRARERRASARLAPARGRRSRMGRRARRRRELRRPHAAPRLELARDRPATARRASSRRCCSSPTCGAPTCAGARCGPASARCWTRWCGARTTARPTRSTRRSAWRR